MRYKVFTNNAFNMTSKALKNVMFDLRRIMSDIDSTRSDMRKEEIEYSEDFEMLEKKLKDSAGSLDAIDKSLLSVLNDIRDISNFLDSIYRND